LISADVYGFARHIDELVANNRPPESILMEVQEAMAIVGDRYRRGEIFLTDMLVAAQTFKESFGRLTPLLKARDGKVGLRGRVVLGTIEGDVHHIGKDLVAVVFESSGLRVVDLGEDVPVENFMAAVREQRPNALGMSCLVSTAMINMKRVIEELTKAGHRGKTRVIIGGTAATEEFARQIGADAYGKDPFEGSDKLARLLEGRTNGTNDI
jgi:methanogenic corrinoid protein MtbC1